MTERLKALLPPDGTPVLNRVLRLMLSRDFGQSISDALYEQARDSLFASGQIGRLRGQGGQVFLAKSDNGGVAEPTASDAGSKLSESELMPHLGRYLKTAFRKELDIPAHGEWLVKDTSQMGPPRGRWARPDFVLLTAMRFRVMPGAQLDVYSFELKAEYGATDLAVYEALAQTRFTHFGYLVWHLPEGSPAGARLPDITGQCGQHGIGLIRVHEPATDDGFETVLDPIRKPTPPAAVDSFLERRLSEDEQKLLRSALAGTAA
ncbi:hypothetical protein [Rhodopseudomonas palustris]|uniref:hypothetical protein n=1 Tax=Rhodopseudomonas palustris TaxID=1076 RepID=UPI0002D3179D